MNGFQVLPSALTAGHTRVGGQRHGHTAHQILNEVKVLGDAFAWAILVSPVEVLGKLKLEKGDSIFFTETRTGMRLRRMTRISKRRGKQLKKL